MISNSEKNKRNHDDQHNRPEIDQLRRKDRGIAIRKHGKVVTLDVEEREDHVAPSVLPDEARPALEAVLVDGPGGVDEVEQDVVEPGLKGGDGGALGDEEGGEGVGRGDAKRQDLSSRSISTEIDFVGRIGQELPQDQDNVKVFGFEICKASLFAFLDLIYRPWGLCIDFLLILAVDKFWCGMGICISSCWRCIS